MSHPTQQLDASTLLVVHEAGGSIRLVAAALENGRPRLLEALETPASSREAVTQAIERHEPARVLRILPASNTVCRTCSLRWRRSRRQATKGFGQEKRW